MTLKRLLPVSLLGLLIVTLPSITLESSQENIVSGMGTVIFLDFEGGFYGIVSDDGEHYDPVNLSQEFQVDGLRVHFEATILEDVVSIHMWGRLVSIRHIEKLNIEVPEFPSFLILPLFMIATLLAVAVSRTRDAQKHI